MKEYRKHEIHLFGTDGQIWQRQKQIISQFFSSFYLKLMTKKIANSIEILFNKQKRLFSLFEVIVHLA